MSLKHPFILSLVACVLCLCSSCASLRFAPSQEQKQLALDTHLTACHVDKAGAMPASPETSRLVSGTRNGLSYIGVPANPVIEDYTATLAKAESDSIRRPDVNDVFGAAGQGLSLAAQLAILLGFGGSAVGGKKVLDWIALARTKSRALEEIVLSSQIFLDNAPADIKQDFKTAQNDKLTGQATETKKLVAEIKLDNS